MATAENGRPIDGGALDNADAATRIASILANTNTSTPTRVKVPDSPKSLSDYFSREMLVGV